MRKRNVTLGRSILAQVVNEELHLGYVCEARGMGVTHMPDNPHVCNLEGPRQTTAGHPILAPPQSLLKNKIIVQNTTD